MQFRVNSVGSLGPHGKSGSGHAFKRQFMIQVIGAQSHLLSGKHGKNSLITGAGREEQRWDVPLQPGPSQYN